MLWLCIVGYLLLSGGLMLLITGAPKESGATSSEIKAKRDEIKARRTDTTTRLVALPMIPIGAYFFLTTRAEPGNTLEILLLLGSALTAIVGLLSLVTGWNFFELLGDKNPQHDSTPRSVRGFGLVVLIVAALVFLRAKMYGLF